MFQQPLIKTGPVGIYARYSSQLQNERSIEDQVRRCRDYVAQQGGDPNTVQIFADFAVSGSSLDRRGFESLMSAAGKHEIKVIVTEDLSRISRDIADSATVFKQLQYFGVPLIGIADGIDTSDKHAKLSFTMKSMVADLYIEDLRDKTLRGLEGRAKAGYATGNVAFGFHTVPIKDKRGEVIGNGIEIHEGEAKIVIRIFREYRDGKSLTGIAHGLNRDGVSSPRVGTRHTAFGWGQSTIRAMLRNERYFGIWRFKEKQWVKVPGTNKRRPRPRDASEVIIQHRPELRIIEAPLWTAVQERLVAIGKRYARIDTEPGILRRPTNYLLSGLIACARCGAPMSLSAGSSAAYYRCQVNRTKGESVCSNRVSVREDVARLKILGGIQDFMLGEQGIPQLRARLTEDLANYRERIESEISTRRIKIESLGIKLKTLGHAVADGADPKTLKATMHELEALKAHQEAELDAFIKDSHARRWKLPTVQEVEALVSNLDSNLNSDPELGRAQLRRWLNDSFIKIDKLEDGDTIADIDFFPARILLESQVKTGGRTRSDFRDNSLILLGKSSGGRI